MAHRFVIMLLVIGVVYEGATEEVSQDERPEILTRVAAGTNFVFQLNKYMFFELSDVKEDDPVQFMPSLVDKPDPPSWMKFIQRNTNSGGLLYGTPKSDDDSADIEVLAVNLRTLKVGRKTFHIPVDQAEEKQYVVEMRIRNYNVEDILSDKNLNLLTRKMRRAWGKGKGIKLIKVMSLADLQGRNPVPAKPGQEVKEGVLVQLGGDGPFSQQLKVTEAELQQAPCSEKTDFGQPEITLRSKFQPQFDIEWCEFRLINKQEEEAEPEPAKVKLDDSGLVAEKLNPGRRRMQIEFLLIIILPVGLGLLILLTLSCIMFCGREGLSKRNTETPETQLDQFDSIKRATTNLRYMSTRRDGPLPLVGRSTSAPALSSDRNTLPRRGPSNAQGPYDEDTAGDSDRLVSEPVRSHTLPLRKYNAESYATAT